MRPSRGSCSETAIKPAAHLTCVAAAREEIDAIVRDYWDIGVRHIVALRGDPQEDPGRQFRPHPEGYANSAALVPGFSADRRFRNLGRDLSRRPSRKRRSADADIDVLKAKIDAGASRAITQFFFENEIYLRFLDKVRARGNRNPDHAGHRAGAEFSSRPRISPSAPAPAFRNGSPIVSKGSTTIRKRESSSPRRSPPNRCSILSITGSREFHFYTMNRADLVYAICHLLGLRPKLEQKAA